MERRYNIFQPKRKEKKEEEEVKRNAHRKMGASKENGNGAKGKKN